MKETENTVLFGKYQIIGTLGSGRNGSVLLALHTGLHEYRAVKRVPKSAGTEGLKRGEPSEMGSGPGGVRTEAEAGFLREAGILKSLRHPGIPVIYDLEEDQSYYYIIEEYLEGHSLSALVKERGSLTRAEILSYGNDLCRILVYLHSLKPNPILHLDLQPKNLLICGGALKLIDFDQAVFAARENGSARHFATPGFAAPELYEKGIVPDERADIYAIGALLYFMGTGRSPEPGGAAGTLWEPLNAVIGKCLSPQREKRFLTARELLRQLDAMRTGVFNEDKIPLLTIAVAGICPGAGATHVSLALAAFLTRHAGPCLYEERNRSCAASSLAKCLGARLDRRGIFNAGIVAVKPSFGEKVYPDRNEFPIRVADLGTEGFVSRLCEPADLLILVCGGREWELSDSQRALKKCLKAGVRPQLKGAGEVRQEAAESPCTEESAGENIPLKLLINRRQGGGRIVLPEEAKGYGAELLPWIEEPFERPGREAEQAFYRLLSGTAAERWLLKEGEQEDAKTPAGPGAFLRRIFHKKRRR